jgi:cell division protein FtsB
VKIAMISLNNLYDKLKKSGVILVFAIFSFYFTINAVRGERGFFRYMYLKGKVEAAQEKRDHYAGIKKDLEHKVRMLSETSLDLDYLEERARIVLNMASDDEYVIIDRALDKN